jgi:hypothetical protein
MSRSIGMNMKEIIEDAPDDLDEFAEEEFQNLLEKVQSERYPEAIVKAVFHNCLKSFDTLDETTVGWARMFARIIEEVSFSELHEDGGHEYLWTSEHVSLVPPDSLSDDAVIHSNRVLDEITARTKEVRKNIFGKEEPPFTDYTDACRWIRNETDNQKGTSSEDRDGLRRQKQEEIMQQINEYRNQFGDVECTFSPYSITYYDVPEWEIVTVSDIPPGSRLDDLIHYLSDMTDKTGFTEPALVLFFMTGVRPILPRWKLQKLQQEELNVPDQYQLNLFTRNITEQDFERIHRKLGELEQTDQQPLDEKDRILIETVDMLGGVPDEGVEAFWRDVLERCRQRGITSWNNYNSAKMRWRRLQERLGPPP